ncbi:hypothetical protein Btru_014314 [Bulinus truncatus]|nr:hypothetical protein Btru_014314 [Bulinus truncatus]
MINSNRDVLSIWNSIGEKLTQLLSDKKKESLARRQHIGLQMAGKLLKEELTVEQVIELILSPNFAKCLFYAQTKKSITHASMANDLCAQICLKLKTLNADILELIEKIWKLQSSLSEGEKSDQMNIVSSNNFYTIMDLMTSSQAESYVKILTSTIKGKDKWQILSDNPKKQLRQLECCLRHLQHLTCSQQHTTIEMQKSVLSLFLRLACFRVEKKTKSIQHCERCCNYDAHDSRQKLCETAFYKCLDSLSTLKSGHQSKLEQFSGYLQLLFHLVEYIQTLLSADTVNPLKTWPEEIKIEWDKLFALASKIKEETKEQKDVSLSSAFLLLFLFLGILMLTDFKNSKELLKDVYICYEKANTKKKKKTKDEEPHWMEVVTEVLLSLLLLPSHLGRVIITAVFKSMLDHITPSSVGLITDVLIPKKTGAYDAGGVLVDAGVEVDEDDDDDEEDVDEPSGDEDDQSDEEDMDAEDEEEEEAVDESFRLSVKAALGKAAVDKDDEAEENDEDMPDLSDSEMFKLDDMLAEVFRQRKMAGGKKAKEEKRKETDNFRIRVLDLVEALIKSERCGDFLVDLLKPILLLVLKTNPLESHVVCDKAKHLFTLLKTKAKGQKDSVHSEEQHKNIFVELIELAQSVVDANHMQYVSAACFTVMNLSCGDKTTSSSLPSQYVVLLKETLQNVLKKPKKNFTFFSSLIELDPVKLHILALDVLNHLKDETTRTHSKMICCSILVSLAKKTGSITDEDKKKLKKWMNEAASTVQQLILSLEKETSKVMLTNSILSLAIALQSRTDIFMKRPFDATLSKHLSDIKPMLNTDQKRLANKIIASIEKGQLKGEPKIEQKRKSGQEDEVKSESSSPAKKKRKL